jgi:fructose-bisphosphate aldolase class II
MVNEFGGQMPNAIGVPEDELREASKLAVCKINIDSDIRLAMTGTVRKFFIEHPDKFDPREFLKPARANVKELVRHKLINVLGCAGKGSDCL